MVGSCFGAVLLDCRYVRYSTSAAGALEFLSSVKFFKRHWQLVLMTAVVFACWGLPVVYPLKLLVVFLHEASHAVAALVTGGEVLELGLSPQEGGHVVSKGGNGFLIASAGYLGSLLFGVAIFMSAVRTKWDQVTMVVLGVFIISISVLYAKETFAWAFGLMVGGTMLLAAKFLGKKINDFLLRLIGLVSMIYVPWDIFSDTLARSELRSDARIIAEMYGGTTMMWGSLWLLLSLCVIWWCLKVSLRRKSNI
ncbi:MAG: M50 family metallopeptidase [Verrucomicrobiota bacterium]